MQPNRISPDCCLVHSRLLPPLARCTRLGCTQASPCHCSLRFSTGVSCSFLPVHTAVTDRSRAKPPAGPASPSGCSGLRDSRHTCLCDHLSAQRFYDWKSFCVSDLEILCGFVGRILRSSDWSQRWVHPLDDSDAMRPSPVRGAVKSGLEAVMWKNWL